jgi:membrane protein YqaA with SNARE-associated domain
VTGFFEPVFRFLLHLGGWGLFSLGIVDAILFTPLANDVLLVALVSAHGDRAIYYAGMAAAGSLIGCAILETLSRKGGEAGLEKTMSKERIDWVKKKITTRAGWAVALACIMPPPFPFTPVIAGAAALQYPRVKLLSIVAAVRVVRFGVLAYLASRYGKHILKIAELPAVRWSVIGLIVLSIAGSAWTIWSKWKKRK